MTGRQEADCICSWACAAEGSAGHAETDIQVCVSLLMYWICDHATRFWPCSHSVELKDLGNMQ